ncbi:MAG: hypothetical protein ACR2FM_03170 [Candidatus Saccharimonadales bacterium]
MQLFGNGEVNKFESLHKQVEGYSSAYEVMSTRWNRVQHGRYNVVASVTSQQAYENVRQAKERREAELYRLSVEQAAMLAEQTPAPAEQPDVLPLPDDEIAESKQHVTPQDALQRVNDIHAQPKPASDTHNFNLPG